MLDDLKKELTSFKLLTFLLIFAVSIYLFRFILDFVQNFYDIFLILIFGWLLSFILEPLVDLVTKYLKAPRVVATGLVFLLLGAVIVLGFLLFLPDVTSQLSSLQKIVPQFLDSGPPFLRRGADTFINGVTNYADLIPSVTQFVINLVTILILSFYLILEKKNMNKKLFAVTPRSWHEQMRYFQHVVDQTFASFVRVQLIYGVIGGLLTWIVLSLFGVGFTASTSLLAGILTAVPMIGPIIGVIPPLLVALIEDPDRALLIFLVLFIIQQFIFNVFGPKLMSKAFQINPILVMFGLLIGIKIAGFTGAVFAVPVLSIATIVGKELYTHYIKEED